ncbi:hypothetical protein HII31_11162 [Pseudocercospora fuligena]|uniref:BTB domain-containing protein n=1 Tax=Pseudocercospora fuligena TaxID=685502 RepID=A0A8H6RAN5_9PEZI|nr:hypothetical protein HII31_11162 [Pseudocercospora fuligena]
MRRTSLLLHTSSRHSCNPVYSDSSNMTLRDEYPQIPDLIKSLQTDRLINITIAQDTTPIRVQQNLLDAASAWFEKALRRDAFLEGKEGKLDFPDDGREAWECLIYWMFKREAVLDPLPDGALVLIVKCWNLGEKYDIKQFQDECMLRLIRYFEHSELSPKDHDLGQILHNIRPASKLARLFAEELVQIVFNVSSPVMTWDELSALKNIGNVWSAIGEAQGRLIVETDGTSLLKIVPNSIFTSTKQKRKNIHLTRPHTRLAHIQSNITANMCEAVRKLANSKLKKDRLIKLYVADDDEPYLIPESRLNQASEYFASAIKHEKWGAAQDGKLNFPDDDRDAFELLVFFIVEGSLPNFESLSLVATQKLLIETWAVADKYLMRDLQDLLMVAFLYPLDIDRVGWEALRCGFEKTSEGSKMWRVTAEEALCRTFPYASFERSDPDEVKELERAISGIEGALCAVLGLREEYDDHGDMAGRLQNHVTSRPYLYGSFEPGSRAYCYMELLQHIASKAQDLFPDIEVNAS